MTTVKLMTAEVNGKKIGFSSVTEFFVQVSRTKNSKSSYKTKAKFVGADFQRMAIHFQGINIGNGFRKRIVMGDTTIIRCK